MSLAKEALIRVMPSWAKKTRQMDQGKKYRRAGNRLARSYGLPHVSKTGSGHSKGMVKISKERADYREVAENESRSCHHCEYFQESVNKCKRVLGKVAPEGGCDLFEEDHE